MIGYDEVTFDNNVNVASYLGPDISTRPTFNTGTKRTWVYEFKYANPIDAAQTAWRSEFLVDLHLLKILPNVAATNISVKLNATPASSVTLFTTNMDNLPQFAAYHSSNLAHYQDSCTFATGIHYLPSAFVDKPLCCSLIDASIQGTTLTTR